MEIGHNRQYNPSFGTKIKVISPMIFPRIKSKLEKKGDCEYIHKYFCNENSGYRTDVNNMYTLGIQDCVAGVVVKEGERAPLAFHLYGLKNNVEDLSKLDKHLEGDNAILVGSHNFNENSRTIYKNMQKSLAENGVDNVTRLEETTRGWETHMAYSSSNDTLYLSVVNCRSRFGYAKSMKDLKQAFKKVEISPADTIEFYGNPLKELSIKV